MMKDPFLQISEAKKKNAIARLKRYRESHPPSRVFEEYRKGLNYKSSNDVFENAKKNENFFIGKQWEGVNAPNMDKPVFNILKRVINYFIANLVSDKIGIHFSLINRVEDDTKKIYLKAVRRQIELVMEQNKYYQKARLALRDAAVTGNGCMHLYYDPAVKTGHEGEEGGISVELIDATDVIFGNPMTSEVQEQPYIIIAARRTKQSVLEELERLNKESLMPEIVSDGAENPNVSEDDDLYDDKLTVLTKYYKRNGRVFFTKVTKNVAIFEPTDTGMELYPVCYMNWERKKNSMHGVGIVDGLIPNQIAINKMAAMSFQFIKQQAFPRVIYNKQKIERWQTGLAPIAVNGDPNDVLFYDKTSNEMSSAVPVFFEKFVSYTRDLMGASDAALGNVAPDNTSAIIAVQKATAIPLELVKQEYYQFVEDFVRINIEIMKSYFGVRTILVTDEAGNDSEQPYDFSLLNDMVFALNVDIGASNYWQETTDIGTLDNLRMANVIDDLTYVESLPEHSVPNREKIIETIRERQEAAQMQNEAALSEGQGNPSIGNIQNDELGILNN